MKHLVALVFLFFTVAAFADNPPAISAGQAFDAAEKSINDRGLGKEIYIESVTLTRTTMFGGENFWFVKYSHPIAAEGPNQHEVGIQVRMDGSVARMVKNLGKS